MEYVLAILIVGLKLISALLGGVFGGIALIVDYKDTNGNITKWGKIALSGVVVTTIIAVSAQGVEYLRSDLDARESSRKAAKQLDRSNSILGHLVKLQRATQPLDLLEISIDLEFPPKYSGVESLSKKLRELVKTIHKIPFNKRPYNKEYFINITGSNHEVISLEISTDSIYFPAKHEHAEIHTLLSETGVDFSFIADKTSFKHQKRILENSSGRPSTGYFGQIGDYAFGIGSDDKIKIDYNVERDVISISIEGKVDAQFLRKTGNINTVPDFEESYAIVSIDDTTVPEIGKKYPVLRAARRALVPSVIFIRTSGREYILRKGESIKTPSGLSAFVYGPIGKLKE